jgi:putative FmdB family regulatory protein
MPIYEYECETCGKSFEVLQSITEEPLVENPDCEQDNSDKKPCSLKKLLFASAIKFEGSDWTPKFHN